MTNLPNIKNDIMDLAKNSGYFNDTDIEGLKATIDLVENDDPALYVLLKSFINDIKRKGKFLLLRKIKTYTKDAIDELDDAIKNNKFDHRTAKMQLDFLHEVNRITDKLSDK